MRYTATFSGLAAAGALVIAGGGGAVPHSAAVAGSATPTRHSLTISCATPKACIDPLRPSGQRSHPGSQPPQGTSGFSNKRQRALTPLPRIASAGQVDINFDDLPQGGTTGVVVTNQYPSATFSSTPGNVNYVTTQPTYNGSKPNFLCTGPAGGSTDCAEETIVDFTTPVNSLTFDALGVDYTGTVADIDVFGSNGLLATVPVIGRASALNPELQDLSSYSNITRIRIYNITDGGGIGWDDFIFTPGLSITSKALLNGTKGSMYSEAVYAAGGIAPYTWSVQSGQLPLGLNLSPAGVLAGTPTTPGSYTFALQVSDSTLPTPLMATASLSVTIAPSHHPWLVLQVHPSTPVTGCPNATSNFTATGGGWLPGEKVDIYVDTAAGANFIATTTTTQSTFATQCVVNFGPALQQPGDSRFSNEAFPVVAMGNEGDAATITDVTAADISAGEAGSWKFKSSKTEWTVSGGCLDDSSLTASPITPTSAPGFSPIMAANTGLDASGASITYAGQPVTLASVNWYGAEEADFVPGGLQCQSIRSIASEIKTMGFNSVRLPWSNAMLDQDPGPCPAAQPGSMLVCVPPEVLTANPALQNQHAMDIYSQIVQALTSAGLMVILDNHGTDAAWTPGKFNLSGLWWGGQFWDNRFGGFGAKRAARTSQWVNDWVTMVNRFSANPYVIGADLRNEPSSTPYSCVLNTKCTAQWGSSVKSEDWLAAAVRAGTAILNANTNLLIFVESIDLALDGFPSAVPLPAGHVVDSVHYYPGDHTANWTPVVGTTPVWVGEVGITISCIDNPSTCGPKETPAFATNFMQLVNSYPPGEIGWSWWPVNKTHSDEGIEGAGSGTTFYDHETYGLLSNSWNEEASQSLMGDLGFPPT